jgi:hypothetical protein
MPKGGFEPPIDGDEILRGSDTFATKLKQIKTVEEIAPRTFRHQNTISEHQPDTFLHEKCVICVSHIPDDLATVICAWDSLPAPVKAGIVAMVTAVRQS